MSSTKSILIVDDNFDDRQLISLLFKKSQFCFIPTFVSSLTEARKLLQEERFDVITLDGMIPDLVHGGLGRSLIPVIRNSRSSASIVIMICGERSEAEKGKNDGADFAFTKDILTKPVRFDETFALIPAKVRTPQWFDEYFIKKNLQNSCRFFFDNGNYLTILLMYRAWCMKDILYNYIVLVYLILYFESENFLSKILSWKLSIRKISKEVYLLVWPLVLVHWLSMLSRCLS